MRNTTRARLRLELRLPDEADLEVLADGAEEAGRVAQAELLRRGHDLPHLPW